MTTTNLPELTFSRFRYDSDVDDWTARLLPRLTEEQIVQLRGLEYENNTMRKALRSIIEDRAEVEIGGSCVYCDAKDTARDALEKLEIERG